jgi:hypothetical protein
MLVDIGVEPVASVFGIGDPEDVDEAGRQGD